MIILLLNLLPLLAGAGAEAPLHKLWRDSLEPEFHVPIASKPAGAEITDDHGRFRREAAQNSELDVQEQFCSSIGTLIDVLDMDQRPLLLHTMAQVSGRVGLDC